MASDLSSLAAAFHSLRAAGEDFVLATIVATEGSTYRKAGARMILARSGACYGLLGGGSFEDDLRQAAQPSFSGGCHLSLSCEMPSPRDADPEGRWQRDGVARILLQYHSPDDGCRAMSLIAGALESRSTRVLVTITDSARADLPMGTSILSGSTLQDELAADLADEITATAAAVLASGPTMLVRHAVGGGEIEVFYAQIHPPLHLLIVGAGPDAEPLARLAGVLGWQITVVDARAAFCRADRFPDAIEVCAMGAAEFPVRLYPDHFDAAVLMTRNFDLDQDFLERIALTPFPVIGLLGSKARCARLLEATGDTAARRLAGRVRG
ncbi:MAG: XdhC family protein, partial [Gammaproteobacteria bacterium]|nr:XdhC family protein [Gammaproteobacteria bacterium]